MVGEAVASQGGNAGGGGAGRATAVGAGVVEGAVPVVAGEGKGSIAGRGG
jgi:hypothetical protein